MASIRKQLHRQLDTAAWLGKGLSPFNRFVFALVLASIVIVVIETEPAVYSPFSNFFDMVDYVGVVLFCGFMGAVIGLSCRLYVRVGYGGDGNGGDDDGNGNGD